MLTVVAFHAFPDSLAGGFIGVDVFFVISGYLISTIILSNLAAGTFSFTEFYARRIRRIFPALTLVLAVSYGYGWFNLLADEYGQLGKHIAAGAGFVSNLILWSESGYFDNAAETKPLLHLWSLGIEEQFYILWPITLWLVWRWPSRILSASLAFALVSLALNVLAVDRNPVSAFYSPLTRFWELLAGSLLAFLALRKRECARAPDAKAMPASVGRWHWPGIANGVRLSANHLSSLGCLLLACGFWQINAKLAFPGFWALLPVAGAALVIAAGPQAWVNRHILSRKAVVLVGAISFPLYLWHWPLLSFARIAEGAQPEPVIRMLAVGASLALAWCTYRFVERPLRFGGHGHAKVALLVLAITAVGFVGYNTHRRDGLKFRATVRSASTLISELSSIGNEYDYFGYKEQLRLGTCHSVSPVEFRNNGCIDLRKRNILIWGDSYAAALYRGLEFVRNRDFTDFGLIEMTDGNGPPFGTDGKTDDGKTVAEANDNRFAMLAETRPDVVLIAWMVTAVNAAPTKEASLHELNRTLDRIRSVSPRSRIVVVGPFPRWEGTLRKQLIDFYSGGKSNPPIYMTHGLVALDREWDRFFAENLRPPHVTYVSAQDALCDARGCLTRLSDSAADLTAVDWGHLNAPGSIFLIDKVKERIFVSD